MSFSSLEFLIFFPIVVIVFFLLAHKWRWMWLLATSCFFFCYFYYTTFDPAKIPYYSLLILSFLSVIIIDYILGISIENIKASGRGSTKPLLVLGIILPLILLFIFKYFNFIDTTIFDIARLLRLHYPQHVLKLIIPVGISYYTFQSISYLIEINRGTLKAERHFGIFSLYFLFFPKIVAGPIERPHKLIPQFYQEQKFDYQRITNGLKLIAWGFFKKLVIADRLAIIVNEIYNNTHDYWGIYFIVATVFFSIQIYCDFAGYSDIAIGTGEVLGFRLMDNFRRPFLSPSIAELWRRWHISLITWFRDYVYIPMGGNRVTKQRWRYNMFLTFFLSGIWHGANWTFVLWASLNGLYVLCSDWTSAIRKKLVLATHLDQYPRLHQNIGRINTFLLFSFAAIFFRANTISDALYIVRHLFSGIWDLMYAAASLNFGAFKQQLIIPTKITVFGFSKPAFVSETIIIILALITLLTLELLEEKTKVRALLSQKPWYVRWPLYFMLMYSILFLGIFANQQFIYFRF